MKTKKNLGKIAAKLTASLLVVAMLLGGTYAWTDYTQHRTNTAAGTLDVYDVTLNDDFKDKEDDWKVGPGNALTKNVSVTNRGEGDVYVRLALKEFMSIAEHEYEHSAERYATYSTGANIGKFIVNTDQLSQTDANAWAASLGYTGKAVYLTPVSPLNAFPFGYPAGWYIETQFDDIDGQYGKFLTTNITTDNYVPLAPLAATAKPSNNLGDDGHNDKIVANLPENAWPLFSFEAGNPNYVDVSTVNADGQIEYRHGSDPYWAIREYVRVLLNNGVIIPYSKWVETNAPVYQWIWNDQNPSDPYIYWGAPLKPGETTADLVKGLELIFQPDGHFIYELFVDMQAVSLEQMQDNWGFSYNNNMLYIYEEGGDPNTSVGPNPTTPEIVEIIIGTGSSVRPSEQTTFNSKLIYTNGTELPVTSKRDSSAGTSLTTFWNQQSPEPGTTISGGTVVPTVVITYNRVHSGGVANFTVTGVTVNGVSVAFRVVN